MCLPVVIAGKQTEKCAEWNMTTLISSLILISNGYIVKLGINHLFFP